MRKNIFVNGQVEIFLIGLNKKLRIYRTYSGINAYISKIFYNKYFYKMTIQGGILQLVATGASGITCGGNANMTFFKCKNYYHSHQFAIGQNTYTSLDFHSFYGKTLPTPTSESFENFKPTLLKKQKKPKRPKTILPENFDTVIQKQYIKERREKIYRNLINETTEMKLFLPDVLAKDIATYVI